jgi:hypothetical protein
MNDLERLENEHYPDKKGAKIGCLIAGVFLVIMVVLAAIIL